MKNINYVSINCFMVCLTIRLYRKSSVSFKKKFVSRVLAYVIFGMTRSVELLFLSILKYFQHIFCAIYFIASIIEAWSCHLEGLNKVISLILKYTFDDIIHFLKFTFHLLYHIIITTFLILLFLHIPFLLFPLHLFKFSFQDIKFQLQKFKWTKVWELLQ